MSPPPIPEVVLSALDAVRLGQIEEAERFKALLLSQGAAESEWAKAIEAAIWHATPDSALPELEWRDDRPTNPQLLRSVFLARAQLLSLRVKAARSTLDQGRDFLVQASSSVQARWKIEHGLCALFEGEQIELPRSDDPDGRIDRAVITALQLGERGRVSEGIEVARRASRMARAEGAPQREYFANLALARLRRIDGQAHLAARIVSAIARVAPSQWHPWLRWELAMVGRLEPIGGAAHGDLGTSLTKMLTAIKVGPSKFQEHVSSCLERVADSPFLRADVEIASQLLDPSFGVDKMQSEVADWALGRTPTPPRGVMAAEAGGEFGPFAYVVQENGQAARRVLGGGIALTQIPEERRLLSPGRVEGLLAVLLLAGEMGVDEKTLFEEVYGFTFRPATHRGALMVAITRARKTVAGLEVGREDTQLFVKGAAPIAVHDPRCKRSINDRILHLVATKGSANARAIAQALGIPLRNAQRALATLVADGHCNRAGQGPTTAYIVEDTTFSEPTSTNAWRPVAVSGAV